MMGLSQVMRILENMYPVTKITPQAPDRISQAPGIVENAFVFRMCGSLEAAPTLTNVFDMWGAAKPASTSFAKIALPRLFASETV